MTPPDPAVSPTLVGVLVLAVTALAGAVVYLWRFYSKKQSDGEAARVLREEQHTKERIDWATDRARLEGYRSECRAEFEKTYRELVEKSERAHRDATDRHDKLVREISEASREHEDTVRREYAKNIEIISERVVEAAEKISTVFEKFAGRFAGGRPRS